MWCKLFPTFHQVRELRPTCNVEIVQTADITLKEGMTLSSCQEKDETKMQCLLVAPQRIPDTCIFLFFFFLWHVQYVNRSYKYLSYFISSIKDMPNIKHQNSSKVVKSWVCGVQGFSRRRYMRVFYNTWWVLDTTGPNYLSLPPLLNHLFSLKGQGDNQSQLK